MSDHRGRNEALIRTGIEATNRGDLDVVTALLDPEIESHVAPGLGNPGTWHGIDGYREMVETWSEAFATQTIDVGGVEFADDDLAVAEVRVTAVGAGSGVPVEMTLYYMLEIRDGRAVRFHIYATRDAALQAATGPMVSGDERVELVMTGWRAFEEGNVAAVLEYFDPAIVVHASAEAGNPGTFHGHDGFLSWVGHWYEAWEDFSQEVVGVEPVGERCVIADVRQVARGRTAGLELERTAFYLYELRDRKVVYLALFVDGDAARAAALEREGS